MNDPLSAPMAIKFQRTTLRLVHAENTLASLLAIVERIMTRDVQADVYDPAPLEELRALRERFEQRKRIGMPKKKKEG